MILGCGPSLGKKIDETNNQNIHIKIAYGFSWDAVTAPDVRRGAVNL